MKVLVLGAGGVGGYFGGRLVEAGADVTFLVRPKRAELLRQHGLRIKSKAGDFSGPVKVVTQDELKPGYDLVMLTSKAYDLESAIAAIAPAVTDGAMVVPFLNGMSHLSVLDRKFGKDRVLGGVAYIPATLAADGTIVHLGDFHRVTFGPRRGSSSRALELCKELAAHFANSKTDGVLNEAIEQAMWDKWVFLATVAGMTCLMRSAVCDILSATAGERIMLAMLSECVAVAAAEGFAPGEAALAGHRKALTNRSSTATASMMRDTEQGGLTEADHILGALLDLAKKHSIAAPILEIAYTHMQAYDARRARESREG
jgi:2-dehydropantoate 2-reductase